MIDPVERCVDCRRIKYANGRWTYSAGPMDVGSFPRQSMCPDCSAKRFPDFHADSNGELELGKGANPTVHSRKRVLDFLKTHFSRRP